MMARPNGAKGSKRDRQRLVATIRRIGNGCGYLALVAEPIGREPAY
jgi:hypothetical protein